MLWHEVLVIQKALVRTTETSLHGENIGDLELAPKGHSSRSLFWFVHTEARILKGEVVEELTHYEWEYTCCMRPIFEIVSVHEDVLAPWVSMKVAY